MYADFNLKRELKNELEYGKVYSPTMPLHFHSHLELYLVRSGKIEVIINNRRQVLGEGDICFSFSYDPHGYRTVEKAVADYLIVPLSCCGEFLPLLSNRHAHFPFLSDPSVAQRVAAAFEGLYVAEANELLRRGYVYVILGAILEGLSPADEKESVPDSSGISAEILIYISRHFREKLTLSAVAREFGYHPSYLSRSFQQTFGLSFVRYLTMLRMREAILLLRSRTGSVTECVFESGFGSMRSFYRAFGEEFGCTPKEYLKEEWRGE